jgi:hypothetical protein
MGRNRQAGIGQSRVNIAPPSLKKGVTRAPSWRTGAYTNLIGQMCSSLYFWVVPVQVVNICYLEAKRIRSLRPFWQNERVVPSDEP